ncbi:PE family protein [Mycobacterium tuberculosis RGTB423]|nr:PE family protein [Mycobacterium tuberculosis RGTB423]
MSFVIAAPEALDSAATDLVVLGSTLGAATAAAAAQTTGIVAAAHDEALPAAIAALFSAHGQAYQAASAQAAAFHTRFIRARSRHPQQETTCRRVR